jgi:hypothetical protein
LHIRKTAAADEAICTGQVKDAIPLPPNSTCPWAVAVPARPAVIHAAAKALD